MKIWTSYSSEHSMNLVMIGHFKSATDAEKAQAAIDLVTERVQAEVDAKRLDVGSPPNRFSRELLDLMSEAHLHILGTNELEQFLYDVRVERKDKDIVITTDEADVSAFMKLLIDKGAKVEVFSAHTYPDAKPKRGP